MEDYVNELIVALKEIADGNVEVDEQPIREYEHLARHYYPAYVAALKKRAEDALKKTGLNYD